MMLSDISPITLLTITGALLVTALGEYSAIRVKLSFKSSVSNIDTCNNQFYWTNKPIEVSRVKTYLITIIFLFVAISRFRNLMRLVREYGNVGSSSNVLVMLGAARVAYIKSSGAIKLGNFFTNQLVYVSEIAGYFFIFIFLYNFIVCKKQQLFLLLPLIPDFIMRLVSTSRTAFLMIFLAFVVLYFLVQDKNIETKKLRIPNWLIIMGGIFVVLFLWYGIIRNDASSIPIIDYLQMYTCSSIYALDYRLVNGWDPNIDFGFNTLGGIYDLFHIPRIQKVQWGTGMVTFNIHGAHSNIFTALLPPIMDFGFLWMFIIRFFEAFVTGKIISKVYKSNQTNRRLFIWMYFALFLIYCYFMFSTGNSFPGFFAQPDVMFRYFVYGWLFLIILNPEGIKCRGKVIKTIFSFNI